MAKTQKAKFYVPDLEDEQFGISPESIKYSVFKPSTKSSQSSTKSSRSDDTSISTRSSNDSTSDGTIPNLQKTKTLSSKSKDEVPSKLASASRFEDAFSKLKASKFYEPAPTSVASKSTENVTIKPANKVLPGSKTYSVLVNPRQKGNPLLKHIYNVPWEFAEIEPDYVMGQRTCALFLSLKYHNIYPNYIHDRLKSLGKNFQLRVLLVLVDITDPYVSLRELSKIAILTDCTLMLAWNSEEAGRYIETYKAYENKPPDLIMEKQDADTFSKLVDALTSVKSINRTDATNLLITFGTMEKIMNATLEQLSVCPGMGPQKVIKLYDVLHQPFLKSRSPKKS